MVVDCPPLFSSPPLGEPTSPPSPSPAPLLEAKLDRSREPIHCDLSSSGARVSQVLAGVAPQKTLLSSPWSADNCCIACAAPIAMNLRNLGVKSVTAHTVCWPYSSSLRSPNCPLSALAALPQNFSAAHSSTACPPHLAPLNRVASASPTLSPFFFLHVFSWVCICCLQLFQHLQTSSPGCSFRASCEVNLPAPSALVRIRLTGFWCSSSLIFSSSLCSQW